MPMPNLATTLTRISDQLHQARTLLEIADTTPTDQRTTEHHTAEHRATAKNLITDAIEQLTTATQSHTALTQRISTTVQSLRASIPVPDQHNQHNEHDEPDR